VNCLRFGYPSIKINNLLFNTFILLLLLSFERVIAFKLTFVAHGLHSLPHLVKFILLKLFLNFFFRELLLFFELTSMLISLL